MWDSLLAMTAWRAGLARGSRIWGNRFSLSHRIPTAHGRVLGVITSVSWHRVPIGDALNVNSEPSNGSTAPIKRGAAPRPCRPSFWTKHPDIADWNQSPTGTSYENGPGQNIEPSHAFTTYGCRPWSTYGNGIFLKRTSTLAVAIVAGRFEFPPTISNISYFLYSHLVSLWYQWHIWYNRISISLCVIFYMQV